MIALVILDVGMRGRRVAARMIVHQPMGRVYRIDIWNCFQPPGTKRGRGLGAGECFPIFHQSRCVTLPLGRSFLLTVGP